MLQIELIHIFTCILHTVTNRPGQTFKLSNGKSEKYAPYMTVRSVQSFAVMKNNNNNNHLYLDTTFPTPKVALQRHV